MRKTKKTPTPTPATTNLAGLFTVLRDESLANERALSGMLNAAVGGGMGDLFGMGAMIQSLAAYAVVQSAEKILRIEDAIRLNPEHKTLSDDLCVVREHFTATLVDARRSLGPDFDRLYEESRREHNDCARANLNCSKGTMYTYVVPRFNDDGTHDPVGPRDFPWGLKPETK